MKSPLDRIGGRPKRSPFGPDLHIYKPPRAAPSRRAKIILVACMGVATLATGLFIHIRLDQKTGDDAIIADARADAPPVAEAAPAAKPAAPAVAAAGIVKPKVVQTISIDSQPPAAEPTVEPEELGHDNPRWVRANEQAASDAKAKAAKAPKPETEASETLAYATDEPDDSDARSDKQFTAAIAPGEAKAQPEETEAAPTSDDDATRTVRIPKAVNLRSNPRSGSKVIKVLPAGANIGIVSCSSWCEVTYEGARGFIYKAFVPGGRAPAKARAAVAAPTAAVKKPVVQSKVSSNR